MKQLKKIMCPYCYLDIGEEVILEISEVLRHMGTTHDRTVHRKDPEESLQATLESFEQLGILFVVE